MSFGFSSRPLLTSTIAIGLAILGSSTASGAEVESESARPSVEIFKTGDALGAAAEERKITTANPKDWQAHHFIAYYSWQQGNMTEAVTEAEAAVKLAPRNESALVNLGLMYESLDGCKNAIAIYKRAIKRDSNNSVSQLGLARCEFKLGRVYDGLAIVENMLSRKSQSFAWYSSTANVCMELQQPELAAQAAKQALSVANSATEKSTARLQLFSALMKDRRYAGAKELMTSVFNDCQWHDYELYVRAASNLLDSSAPDAAKPLMEAAAANFKSNEEAEGLYRLGRIFEEKSCFVVPGSALQKQWLQNAESMYKQAVATAPYQSRYHLAYAGVLGALGNNGEMLDRLKITALIDSLDTMAPFLVSNVSEKSGLLPNLKKVTGEITGLTCSCHISSLETVLPKIDGVAFASISRSQPYECTILLDSSKVQPDQVFEKCKEFIAAGVKLKEPISVTFKLRNSRSVASVEDAVRISQNAKYGDALQFHSVVMNPQPLAPWQYAPTRAISAR